MITTNVSGTTTILAILLNTTNAHASMGVSSWQPSFLAVRFLLWLFRDVPKTLGLFFRNVLFQGAKILKISYITKLFLMFYTTGSRCVHMGLSPVHVIFTRWEPTRCVLFYKKFSTCLCDVIKSVSACLTIL